MINNRQNGRRRGRGGNNGGNGQRSPGNLNSGNRIDSRARGNANQLYEKYKNLARDAQMSGDRVNTEYYLQFADHYFRVLSETRARFEEQNPNAPQQRRIQPVDSFDDFDGDDDFGDEGEPVRAGEQNEARAQQGGNRDGGQGGNRNQGREQVRDQGRDQGRDQQRFTGQRDDGGRDGGGRDGGADGNRRDGQRDVQREIGRRYDAQPAPRRDEAAEVREDRIDRYAMTGSPVANDLGEDSPDGAEPTPIAPRRRGRPRRDAVENGAGNDMAPASLEADRLPPSLSLASVPVASDPQEGVEGEVVKPRRRRARAGAAEAAPTS